MCGTVQVASAYVVIASFGIHVFFNPYRMHFQNAMETLVLLNYVILILIRNNDTILDAVNNGNYYGNQVIAFWVACLSDTLFFLFY